MGVRLLSRDRRPLLTQVFKLGSRPPADRPCLVAKAEPRRPQTTGAKDVSVKPGAFPVILVDGPSIADLMNDKRFYAQSDMLPIYTYALDGVLSDDEDQIAY